ncbi:failed axon connections homolog [Folsomia candida]|uniref:failed axon connections homolog n=1 Tax=Folsomia candida TaxID=158441 RepID=UPI000B8F1024|nr:failed axon connections homolog [Folsomia candida]
MNSKSMSKLDLKDTVILHCIERGKPIPSISPFVLKLETYLRMVDIPYQVDTTKPFGPSGKTPWISLNGVDMTDSQLIIEFLNKKYDKNPWENVSPEQKASARTVRVMLEEHFFWGMARWRFVEGVQSIPNLINISGVKFRLLKWVFPGRIKKSMNAQGLGRHPPDTIVKLVSDDLKDVSVLLGDKPFIAGDQPCEADCALFGSIAQCVWAMPGSPYHNLVENELTNLKEYCIRMRAKYWADWEDCLFKNIKA